MFSSALLRCLKQQQASSRRYLLSKEARTFAASTNTPPTANNNSEDKPRPKAGGQGPPLRRRRASPPPLQNQSQQVKGRPSQMQWNKNHPPQPQRQKNGAPFQQRPHPPPSQRKQHRPQHQSQQHDRTMDHRHHQHHHHHRPHRKKSRQKQKTDTIPTSCWIQIDNVPILSKLEDCIDSVNEVLNIEKEHGMIDLEKAQDETWLRQQQQQLDETGQLPPLPLLEFPENEGEQQQQQQPWVLSAKLLLSLAARPTGWRLKFANRSIVHAFLQHTKEKKGEFLLAWKPCQVREWDPEEERHETQPHETLQVSDAMIRVENCPSTLSVDYLRHLMRRYDLSFDPPAIQKLEFIRQPVFLVKFVDPTWARAAVREMQSVEVRDMKTGRKHPLVLCTYPKQLP